MGSRRDEEVPVTANPEPDPTMAPWLQQLIREGKFGGMTLDYLASFELFESDAEAEEFRVWLRELRSS